MSGEWWMGTPRPTLPRPPRSWSSIVRSWRPSEIRSHVYGLIGRDGHPREIQARLRLLRVAVRYRATGEILDLADPLGARICHRLQRTRLTIWSAGRDGVDDGGVGDWKRTGDKVKDLVLEVDR
jgi:hypothetical protein